MRQTSRGFNESASAPGREIARVVMEKGAGPEEVLTQAEIERARLELDRKQLEIDKSSAELGKNFLNRNTGVLVSAAVSFAAVIVSLAQVWVTTISKDKEIQISTIQRKAEVESQERQEGKGTGCQRCSTQA